MFSKELREKIIELRLYRTIIKDKLKNNYYKIINIINLKKYNKYKEQRKAKGIIYTCITGNYDSLKMQKYINFDWDYVCFTDDSNMKTNGLWEIKPLIFSELDTSRNNRWHKLNPHIIFPNYDKSIYIDGNIRILSKDFFKELEKKEDSIFISTLHPKRNCLYKEAKVCMEAKLEKKEIIEKQLRIIKEDNFPKESGLYEANVIYRQHNNKKIIKMDEDWWWFVKNLAKRDQLSLTYVCWKNNIPFKTFWNKSFRLKNKYIKITPHLKNR